MVRGELSPLLPRASPCLLSAGHLEVYFCIFLQLPVRLYADVRNINSFTLAINITYTAKNATAHSRKNL